MAVIEPGPEEPAHGLTDEDRELIDRYARKSRSERSPDDLIPPGADDVQVET